MKGRPVKASGVSPKVKERMKEKNTNREKRQCIRRSVFSGYDVSINLPPEATRMITQRGESWPTDQNVQSIFYKKHFSKLRQ